MHAWDTRSPQDYPGWHRAVEYTGRAQKIWETVFPPLLAAVRASPMAVMHVVAGGDYYKKHPIYHELAAADDTRGPAGHVDPDPVYQQLQKLRHEDSFPGAHNSPDIRRGFAELDWPDQARPLDSEGVAENGRQLFTLCQRQHINHLIYVGFAINWCILLSPGGMNDMQQYGLICSTVRDAVTAVENRETARQELCKQIALWRVALAFGFVFYSKDIIAALRA